MAIKAGWTDAGNNLVKNTATGQMLPQDHPDYLNAPEGTAQPRQEIVSDTLLGGVPPASAPAASGAPAGATDPFAASGGGTYVNGGWIPNNNPGAIAAAQGQGASSGAPPGASPMANSPASGAPAGAPITTAQQVTGTTGTVGQTAQAGQPTSVAQSFQDALINRMNPQGLTASNPAIAGSIQANQLQEQRGTEAQRAMLAERAAADGTDQSGGFNTTLAGLMADSAARQGQFAGGAVQHLSDLQNQNQGDAMSQAGGILFGQQGLGQQRDIATMANTTQNKAIDNQSALGNRSIDLQDKLGSGNLNLGLLGLGVNNSQFGQGLGAQLGMYGAGLDNNTLLALLSGL